MMKKYFSILNIVIFASLLSLNLSASEGAEAHALDVLHEIVYPLINFGILLFVLIYFLKKPAKEFFLARSKTLAEDIEKAAHEKQEVEAVFKSYEQRLANIDQEIASLTQNFKNEGELLKQKIIEEAGKSAKHIEEVARWVSNHELNKAREDLKAEMADRVLQLTQKMMEKNLEPADRQKLLQKNLQSLGGNA